MTVVETRISVWEALAGRAPGQPLGPADPGLWTAVAERVDPARARPVLRKGIEESNLLSARGISYAMLRDCFLMYRQKSSKRDLPIWDTIPMR